MKCEVCRGPDAAFHPRLKVHICQPCLARESARDAAFDQRCAEDPAFEDWAAGALE